MFIVKGGEGIFIDNITPFLPKMMLNYMNILPTRKTRHKRSCWSPKQTAI